MPTPLVFCIQKVVAYRLQRPRELMHTGCRAATMLLCDEQHDGKLAVNVVHCTRAACTQHTHIICHGHQPDGK
jgi:hypothetical protein